MIPSPEIKIFISDIVSFFILITNAVSHNLILLPLCFNYLLHRLRCWLHSRFRFFYTVFVYIVLVIRKLTSRQKGNKKGRQPTTYQDHQGSKLTCFLSRYEIIICDNNCDLGAAENRFLTLTTCSSLWFLFVNRKLTISHNNKGSKGSDTPSLCRRS